MQRRVAGAELVDVGKISLGLEQHVAVGEARPLRHAGGAARVEEPRRVVGPDLGRRGLLGKNRVLQADSLGDRSCEIRGDEAGARAGILEDVRELLRVQLGVHRHRGDAGVPAGEKNFVELRAVLHRQGDAVSLPYLQSSLKTG
jgi:hypothetical protein